MPGDIDLAAAERFMATHARQLDRRRLDLVLGRGDPEAALAALGAYRNPDGGYGWGLEPDLRSPESQTGAAHHAFEVLEAIRPHTTPHAAALCGWLDRVTLPDGGLPFALPIGIEAGTARWWREADPSVSSLQITTVATAHALRVAAHDPAVAAHPWLERATAYCAAAIEAMDTAPFAYVVEFAIRFADALHDHRPDRARALLDRLRAFVPPDGRLRVTGGAEDEALHPLDLAPYPDRPARSLLAADVVAADLDRLRRGQQDDGGWTVDFPSSSPAGALEWRGYATVQAIDVLRRA